MVNRQTDKMKAQKIVFSVFLLFTICFLYKFNRKDKLIYDASFFSGGDIMESLKLLPPQEINVLLSDTITKKREPQTNDDAESQKEDKTLDKNPFETHPKLNIFSKSLSKSDVLKGGDSIIFLETTDKMPPTSLVLCAIESAARHYPNRSVIFYMKGLTDSNAEEVIKKHLSLFSSFNNVHFFPLKMEEILSDTPLLSWYQKVNPAKEIYWAHVSSDACRLALLWKHGGLYLDTDFISLRPIPHRNFLAAESKEYSSNAVLGFSSYHEFTWKCMEDFVENYDGETWGYQGPLLFTRIRNQLCDMAPFNGKDDFMCGNITILGPDHFYPIPPQLFKQYYEVWDEEPTFDICYALHLWNYANRGTHVTMVPGSNTLVEHLYQKNCPSVHADVAGGRGEPRVPGNRVRDFFLGL